jgi:hypothetical protein
MQSFALRSGGLKFLGWSLAHKSTQRHLGDVLRLDGGGLLGNIYFENFNGFLADFCGFVLNRFEYPAPDDWQQFPN